MTIQRKIVEKYKEEGLVIDTEDARVHRENLEHYGYLKDLDVWYADLKEASGDGKKELHIP